MPRPYQQSHEPVNIVSHTHVHGGSSGFSFLKIIGLVTCVFIGYSVAKWQAPSASLAEIEAVIESANLSAKVPEWIKP